MLPNFGIQAKKGTTQKPFAQNENAWMGEELKTTLTVGSPGTDNRAKPSVAKVKPRQKGESHEEVLDE